MKLRAKMEPQVSNRLKQKRLLIYVASGIALVALVATFLFFGLNLGIQKDAMAANYSTYASGNWNSNSIWSGGSAPNNWGNHDITLNNNITDVSSESIRGLNSIVGASGVTFSVNGNLTLQQINSITLSGDMTIDGNYSHSGNGTVTISSGNLEVDGNLNLQNVQLIISNGELIVDGNITTSNNSTIYAANGLSADDVSVTGGSLTVASGDMGVSGDMVLTNNALLEMTGGSGDLTIDGNLEVRNGSDITFNSSGTLEVDGNLTTQGGSTKEITILKGTLDVDDDVYLASASVLTIAEGAFFKAENLGTGNNGDAIINIDGNARILDDVDLGGVLNIGETGYIYISEDFTMRNSGTTETNIDGFMEVGDNININNRNLTGTGLLGWDDDLNLNGYNAAINGQKENIPSSILDLSTMQQYSSTLPVELLSFKASLSEAGVAITWATASEENNDYFTLERSVNGVDYIEITEVDGQGTTKAVSNYAYTDAFSPTGTVYYRLTQTDFDGTSETFPVQSVTAKHAGGNHFNLYPNPLTGTQVTLSMDQPTPVTVRVYDSKGNVVFTKQYSAETEVELNLPENMSKGYYIVHIQTQTENQQLKLLKK